MSTARHLTLADAVATEALGAALAHTLPPRAVLHLEGDLGAGKTTLARGLLRALGVTGAVRSPTYTLVERYDTAAGEAIHVDLYRIGDPGELEFLGLEADAGRLWLIEWPQRGAGALPEADLVLRLGHAGTGRVAVLEPRSDAGREWASRAARVSHSRET